MKKIKVAAREPFGNREVNKTKLAKEIDYVKKRMTEQVSLNLVTKIFS